MPRTKLKCLCWEGYPSLGESCFEGFLLESICIPLSPLLLRFADLCLIIVQFSSINVGGHWSQIDHDYLDSFESRVFEPFRDCEVVFDPTDIRVPRRPCFIKSKIVSIKFESDSQLLLQIGELCLQDSDWLSIYIPRPVEVLSKSCFLRGKQIGSHWTPYRLRHIAVFCSQPRSQDGHCDRRRFLA
jgi:hypothetical protein